MRRVLNILGLIAVIYGAAGRSLAATNSVWWDTIQKSFLVAPSGGVEMLGTTNGASSPDTTKLSTNDTRNATLPSLWQGSNWSVSAWYFEPSNTLYKYGVTQNWEGLTSGTDFWCFVNTRTNLEFQGLNRGTQIVVRVPQSQTGTLESAFALLESTGEPAVSFTTACRTGGSGNRGGGIKWRFGSQLYEQDSSPYGGTARMIYQANGDRF